MLDIKVKFYLSTKETTTLKFRIGKHTGINLLDQISKSIKDNITIFGDYVENFSSDNINLTTGINPNHIVKFHVVGIKEV